MSRALNVVKGADFTVWTMPSKPKTERGPLGDLIYKRRNDLSRAEGREVSRAEAGRRIGGEAGPVDRTTVHGWESGRRRKVEPRFLNGLAAFLAISLSDLITIIAAGDQPATKPETDVAKRLKTLKAVKGPKKGEQGGSSRRTGSS